MTALLDAPTQRLAPQSRTQRARHTVRTVAKINGVNFRARLAYRGDFVISIMFGIIWQTSTLMFASVLLTRFKGGLQGFPSSGVLLIIGLRLLSHGVYVLWFSNLAFIPLLVDEGRLDGYFLRPLPVFTQILFSQFSINALGDIAVGATSFGVALHLVHIQWSIGKALYVALAIAGGVLIEGALQLMLSCLLLRSPGSRVLGSWIDELMSTFGNYPLSILPKVVQGLFTFLLPLAFVAYLPVKVLLGIGPSHGPMSWLARCAPLAGFVLFMLARRIWAYSLRHYHSAGG